MMRPDCQSDGLLNCPVRRYEAASSLPRRLAVLLAMTLCLAGLPAAAQVHKLVTENGRVIFVNADDNTPIKPVKPGGKTALSKASQQAPARSDNTEGRPVRRVLSPEEIEKVIVQMAERHHVDPALIRAVIAAESGWNQDATSRKGAQGLMQLMPGTAQQLGVNDAYNAQENIEAGVRYLRALLEKYNGDLDRALAAYNAGEGAVARAGGVPNIRETREYVKKVTNKYYHPGSGRGPSWEQGPRSIHRDVDEHGRVVYTNE
jgi:soluble lytic murein transglycosylase-like protein